MCSEYFKLSCYKRDLQAELMDTKPRNILKNDAVPTIFKHSQGPSRKRVYSLERKSKQAKKQLLQETLGNYEKTITQTQKKLAAPQKTL